MDGAPPRANSKERKGRYGLVCAACDGWDEHDLVAVTFDLGGKRGECLVDVSQKAGEVSGGGVEVFAAVGVAGEGCGKGYFDRHFLTPWINPDEFVGKANVLLLRENSRFLRCAAE